MALAGWNSRRATGRLLRQLGILAVYAAFRQRSTADGRIGRMTGLRRTAAAPDAAAFLSTPGVPEITIMERG